MCKILCFHHFKSNFSNSSVSQTFISTKCQIDSFLALISLKGGSTKRLPSVSLVLQLVCKEYATAIQQDVSYKSKIQF